MCIRTSDAASASKGKWKKYKYLMRYVMQNVVENGLWAGNPGAEQASSMYNQIKISVEIEGCVHGRRHAQLTSRQKRNESY